MIPLQEKAELVEEKVDWKGRTAVKNKHGGARFSSLILGKRYTYIYIIAH